MKMKDVYSYSASSSRFDKKYTYTEDSKGKIKVITNPDVVPKYHKIGYNIGYQITRRLEVYYLIVVGNKSEVYNHMKKYQNREDYGVIIVKRKNQNAERYLYAGYIRKIKDVVRNVKGEAWGQEFVGHGKQKWGNRTMEPVRMDKKFKAVSNKKFLSDRIFLYRNQAEKYHKQMSQQTGYKGLFIAGLHDKIAGCECGGCKGPKTFRVYFPYSGNTNTPWKKR